MSGEKHRLTNKGNWYESKEYAEYSTFSPNGKQVAYVWFNNELSHELRLVGIDGSESRILSSGPSEMDHAPWPRAWSQDGKYILALLGKKDESLERGHEDHIVLVSVADGSVRTLKSLGERHTRNMSLSQDSRYVAFDLEVKEGSEKRDIYLLATDGSGEVPLVEHPADDWAPYWTPDGHGIVFVSDRSGSTGLWMLDVVDGEPMSTPTQIKETGDRFYPKGFTPNGSFYYGVGKPDSDVYVAALDFDTGRVLTPPTKTSLRFEGTNHAPIWSPDGKYLAYASRRGTGGGYVLVIKSVQTGQERDLSPKSLGMAAAHAWGTPRWSPDGRSILVAGLAKGAPPRNRGLHLVDVQ
ncbi:MAG: PD40 domain-containing protein, partial [Gemmatimonadetes bacterium]|nr:PD40 domain-containing protein [Gemmatimonadota bacterium]